MSDQPTSGEPAPAPATATEAAPAAAPTGDVRPIGSFGTAKGSGLSRGKRANPAAPAASAAPASPGAYKPTAVEVITPQREYTHPFGEPTPAPTAVNEPPKEIPPAPAATEPAGAAPVSIEANGPVASASEPPAVTAPAAGEPAGAPPEIVQPSVEKAEIKILPPSEAKRPAVSWGEAGHGDDTRPQREPRGVFQPDRRERKFEPRQPRAFEPREPREPRRDPSLEQRGPLPAAASKTPRAATEKPSGGFIGWLKGLFGGKPAETPAAPGQREQRDGEFRRRRHRGGRGRGGYQGDNRGPREGGQFREGSSAGADPSGDQPQGERRYEGGGRRRRRRGGRGRYRDDRGGPSPEGQQGGGAI